MTQFRLHIDIPLGTDEEEAIEIAQCIMDDINQTDIHLWEESGVNIPEQIHVAYRLGHDEDRQKSNYLNKTEEGHVTKKKIRVVIE